MVTRMGVPMGRMTITVDEALVEAARQALGTRSKRETIVRALEEAARRARLERAAGHAGAIDPGFTGEDVLRWRQEA